MEAILICVLVVLKEDLDLVGHLLANVLATNGSLDVISKPLRKARDRRVYLHTYDAEDSEGERGQTSGAKTDDVALLESRTSSSSNLIGDARDLRNGCRTQRQSGQKGRDSI